MRYVSRDRRVYHDAHCLICGSCYGIAKGEHRLHRPATCSACGTVQCHPCLSNRCAVCRIGRLDWREQPCDYAGCERTAIAIADGGNPKRCREHLERGKWAGYLDKQVAERDRRFMEVDDTPSSFPLL